MYGTNENAIEFLRDSTRATVTFTQGRYKSRIKKLAEIHPEECQIVAQKIKMAVYALISRLNGLG